MFLDILLITIITISIITCFRRGIIQSIFNASSSLLTALLLIFLYKPAAALFKTSDLGILIYESIKNYINSILTKSGNNTIESSDLPEFIKGYIYNSTDNLNDLIIPLTEKIMNIIVCLIVFIFLLIIIKVIFKLLPAVLNSITRLPIINQANKLFGGIAGIIIGIIWCIVAIYIVGLLSLHPNLIFLNDQIRTSAILNFLHTVKISNFLF